MTRISLLLFAFLLGMRHATDPDHLVAVSTVLSRSAGLKPAALIGVFWGLGHSLSILVLGVAIVMFKVVIPPHVGLGFELAVAVMLVGLGLRNLRRYSRAGDSHEGDSHDDRGVLASSSVRFAPPPEQPELGVVVAMRSLFIGGVHGLAGSAAIVLLAVGSIHDPGWAAACLSIFGVGTLAGMTLMTSVLAVPLAMGFRRAGAPGRLLAPAMGVLSVGFGLMLAYRVGFVDGLFSFHPTWIPQ